MREERLTKIERGKEGIFVDMVTWRRGTLSKSYVASSSIASSFLLSFTYVMSSQLLNRSSMPGHRFLDAASLHRYQKVRSHVYTRLVRKETSSIY